VGLGNPNLRVEVPDVGGGVLVALRRVLAEEIGAHARRDARRHAWLPAAAREWKRSRWWWGLFQTPGGFPSCLGCRRSDWAELGCNGHMQFGRVGRPMHLN
jgi:hypothetical protein